jgi:hypothetical protein
MTPGEVEAYERLHALAERMGEDVIHGAPIAKFEECAIAYAEEMHRRTPDERGRYKRWWAMSVMRALLGVTLQ